MSRKGVGLVAQKLNLDTEKIERARSAARRIALDVMDFIQGYTTTSVERTVLRLMGVDGIDVNDIPLANVVVDHLLAKERLGDGSAYWMGNAMVALQKSAGEIAQMIARQEVDCTAMPLQDPKQVKKLLDELALTTIRQLKKIRHQREALQRRLPPGPRPHLYVIVATGNIYEDVIQARSAVQQGADIIAVIRTTGQSLLDYVPFGPTTEGFGGTYATQANFKIMRQALDEVGETVGRYIQLVNYCSGLCMPEIAAMGALERLDMMLNDSMYGILFRDINMKRTFIDQYFSRLINAYSGIIINTGEDNYLTTAESFEEAHTVLASQFINEQLALLSGIPPVQMGLGHAFELDPSLEDGLLYEIAQAQMAREIFPDAPLKYMPPTKYMTGDIFKGHLQDGLFNLVSQLTQQGIHLLGMLTEAVHTPFMHDRALSIENARYIMNNARHLHEEITFVPGGRIQKRAQGLLAQACDMLKEIEQKGLPETIATGMFAEIKRHFDGGKGLDGVVAQTADYYNPFLDIMARELGVEQGGW